MKQAPIDKYNIAWFTLAECVARGEKVRALGVYRLLAHSLDDQAFIRQLEGDILLLFKDDHAFDKYCEAACLYKKNKRFLEAAAIYEHVLSLKPDNEEYREALIDLYQKLNIAPKIVQNITLLFNRALKNHNLDKAIELMEQLDNRLSSDETAQWHQRLACALLKDGSVSHDVIMTHIKKAIDGFFQKNDTQVLHMFLSSLEALNSAYYLEACQYMEEGHFND